MLTWMLSAIVFGAFVAVAAWCGEWVLRRRALPTRWVWLIALALVAVWPIVGRERPVLLAVTEADSVAATRRAMMAPERLVRPVDRLRHASSVALALWAAVSLLLLVRLALAARAVRALRARAVPADVDGMTVLVDETDGPALVGWLAPRIVVPRVTLALAPAFRAMVLRHEWEHLRARDPIVAAIAPIATALLPWNPILWLAARRLGLALEVDCDTRVLASGVDPRRYGQLLLLASSFPGAAAADPLLVAFPSHLERRLDAMSTSTMPTSRLRLIMVVSLLVIATAAACTSRITEGSAGPQPSPAASPQPLEVRQPYFEFQIEKPAQLASDSPRVPYPDELLPQRTVGTVLAQFVVDTLGRVEPTTLKVLRSDAPAFTQAVKAGLSSLRFLPAEIGGRKVKQLVQLPFEFTPPR